MRFYHRTSQTAAEAILRDGFKGATGSFGTENCFSGVWLSDYPLDVNQGAKGDVLLEVTVDVQEADLADYEWVEEGKHYREWLVPAALINPRMKVRIVPSAEEESL